MPSRLAIASDTAGLGHSKMSSALGHAAPVHHREKDMQIAQFEATTETTFPGQDRAGHRLSLYR
jgi:hypothetical protein